MLVGRETRMESYLFQGIEAAPDTLVVEGWHKPGSLTVASGAWISYAGSAVLENGEYALIPHEKYVWLCVESGKAELQWNTTNLVLTESDTCILPAGQVPATLTVDTQAVCLWMALDGPLSATVVRKMGALLHVPLKQRALPSQTYLAKQIVQVVVRHSGTSNATYQLQHLMYGMLASQWGQPVAMDACRMKLPKSSTPCVPASTRIIFPLQKWPPFPVCRWKHSASALSAKSACPR